MIYRKAASTFPNGQKDYRWFYWFEDIECGPYKNLEEAADKFLSALSSCISYNETDILRKLIHSTASIYQNEVETRERVKKEMEEKEAELQREIEEHDELLRRVEELKAKYGETL
tara:strand:- start:670 stop:1014 length:345 start_codon:yes stop_codon:yes gene_type:complete